MNKPLVLCDDHILSSLNCEDVAIVALIRISLKNAAPSWKDKLYDGIPEEERFFGDSIYSHSRTLVPAN